jgi:hypothetical protein
MWVGSEAMKHEPPYNEAWWKRELHRNEKLMDRYLAALADNPDLARLSNPDEGPGSAATEIKDLTEDIIPAGLDALEIEHWEELFLESGALPGDTAEGASESSEDGEAGLGDNPSDDEGYLELARVARQFAVGLGSLQPCPEIPDILFLSAPKIGANLAGGHGLGYDEETLCGNIVKCRWALADCEFCREMLEYLVQKTGRKIYRSLANQSIRLSEQIRERIARLRTRVWW